MKAVITTVHLFIPSNFKMRQYSLFKTGCTFIVCLFLAATLQAQHQEHQEPVLTPVTGVEVQPLLAQALRLDEALEFLGSSLSPADSKRLKTLQNAPHTAEVATIIQEILDPYTLAMLDINPEARVKVFRGPARAELAQDGWTSFLIKVHNKAGVNARLAVESPNAEPVLHKSLGFHRVIPGNVLSAGQLANRFLEVSMYQNRPLQTQLSGLELEYAVVQIYSKQAGKREVKIGFNIGQGTQDIGFRNTIDILFDIKPSVKVSFQVKDADGSPTMGSFVITDGVERLLNDRGGDVNWSKWKRSERYRDMLARSENDRINKRLTGIYPLPSRRVATEDEYPDFFFQPQIYREDGEHVYLPAGNYDITYTRGPEYIEQMQQLTVPAGVDTFAASFELKRWINMAALGWYSSDHHIHAAGCSHYESPSEGVDPEHLWRQLKGEDLNFGGALTWGPSWYHQKQFFTGDVHPLSSKDNILRFDVEVSGFPSSHAGHLSLLNLKEDDYPNTTTPQEWPSWTLPVLQWAKSQGAITGYSHSGSGLQPLQGALDFSDYLIVAHELPNYLTPTMDGIGANEYIVTVAHDVVDFYSAGDQPASFELNMWYHTLNLGFRPRISGESDYPCIYDERVGVGRSYTHIEGGLDFEKLIHGIVHGHSYVTNGKSHIIDFKVSDFEMNEAEMGVGDSTLSLSKPGGVKIKAKVTALLPPDQDEDGATIAALPLHEMPYWHIERARIGTSRKVPVTLVVNGVGVESKEITADGDWRDVSFEYEIKHSSWVAVRVYPSSHTNPIFITVDNKPIISRRSAEWAVRAVDQAWKMKSPMIRDSEKASAKQAYDEARAIYVQMQEDATHD